MNRKELIAKARANKMGAKAANTVYVTVQGRPNDTIEVPTGDLDGYWILQEINKNPKITGAQLAEKANMAARSADFQKIIDAISAAHKGQKVAAMKSKADTDAKGTPEVGGAPGADPVTKPEEIDEQLEAGEAGETAPAEEGTEAAPAAEAPAMPAEPAPGAPAVSISNDSAVALVKMRESYDSLVKETEINEAVIKKMNDILKQAGLPVAAMQKHFNARAALINRISPVEAKKHMEVVAKAQKVVEAMAAENDLTEDEAKELAGIKASLEIAVEKATDALKAVAENKVGDQRKMIADAMRDAQASVKEYGYWKRNLGFKDAVIDSITAVQSFVTAGKIKADDIFTEFDSLLSMTSAERRNIVAYKMSMTPGFVSQGVNVIASMGGAAAEKKDPIKNLGDLAMEVMDSEKVTVKKA